MLSNKETREICTCVLLCIHACMLRKEKNATHRVVHNVGADDIYGKEGLEDGAEPMTKERAMRIFQDFFRYGEAMDPDAPERSKGFKRAAGGVVYAPVKGLMYGGKSVLSGVIMGSAAVVAGAGAMVANVAFGVKEMGEAGVNAARKRKGSKAGSDSGSEAPNLDGKLVRAFISVDEVLAILLIVVCGCGARCRRCERETSCELHEWSEEGNRWSRCSTSSGT